MKVVIITNLFPPKWLAGTEIATYHLAEHLAKRGHEIHVITSHDKGLPNFAKENGFYVHRLLWPNIRIIGVFPFWLQVFLKIRTIKPDIVHAQDLTTGTPAYLSRKILKIPYIVWGRGSDIYRPSQLVRITIPPILQNANAILALTENMRKEIKKNCGTKIYVVPNGIDLEKYNDGTINFDKKTDGKTILFVGSLYPVKGVEYLIAAIKLVQDKIPEARLILVGDGEERERLAALTIQYGIQKYVHFIGKVPHEEVQTFMQQADLFVLPSLSEGFPNVILEAMACGLPIVATKVGGIPDILTNGVHGYLVEPKNSDEIAENILRLFDNDQLMKEISRTNKTEVKTYAWIHIINKLEKIYFKILKDI